MTVVTGGAIGKVHAAKVHGDDSFSVNNLDDPPPTKKKKTMDNENSEVK